MCDLIVGLEGWTIQDGNWPDFQRGGVPVFSFEFHPKSLKPCNPKPLQFRHVTENLYYVVGTTNYSFSKVTVLDFGGLMAYKKFLQLDPDIEFYEGEVYFNVDPYFYRDSISKRTGMPNLARPWKIKKIWHDATPYKLQWSQKIQKNVFRPSENEPQWRQIEKTDAWHDNRLEGRNLPPNPFYLLYLDKRL